MVWAPTIGVGRWGRVSTRSAAVGVRRPAACVGWRGGWRHGGGGVWDRCSSRSRGAGWSTPRGPVRASVSRVLPAEGEDRRAQLDLVAVDKPYLAGGSAIDDAAVGGAVVDVDELAILHPPDLAVPARNTCVIETYITFYAATYDRGLAVQWIFALVSTCPPGRAGLDGDQQAWCSRGVRSRACRPASTGHGAGVGRRDTAADAEHPDIEVIGLGKAHADGTDKRVVLLGCVFADHLGQLVAERLGVGSEPGEIPDGELDRELVGDEYPVGTGRTPVVGLPGQRTGDLDRFDAALEDLGERPLDEAAQAALEAL